MNDCKIRSMRWRGWGAATLAGLVFMAGSGAWADDETAARLQPLLTVLERIDDAAIQEDVLTGILQALEGRRRVAAPSGWARVSPRLLNHSNELVRDKATQLAVLFGDSTAVERLMTTLKNADAPVSERERALQVLLPQRDSQLPSLLLMLVQDAKLAGPAIRALAAFDDPRTPEVLIQRYPQLADGDRRDVIATLSVRAESAHAMLDAVASGKIPSVDVTTFTVRQLLGLKKPEIQKKLEQVWGRVSPTAAEKAALIAEYRSQLSPQALKTADRSHGRLVHSRLCANCHTLFGEGRVVGPDLTGSQRRNVEYLLENILDPSAVVGRDYRLSVVATRDGRVLTGIVKQENANAVLLLTANDQVLIPLDEIEDRKQQNLSLMPEGMLQKLTPAEIRDLIAYLAGETQVPLPAESGGQPRETQP